MKRKLPFSTPIMCSDFPSKSLVIAAPNSLTLSAIVFGVDQYFDLALRHGPLSRKFVVNGSKRFNKNRIKEENVQSLTKRKRAVFGDGVTVIVQGDFLELRRLHHHGIAHLSRFD